jgi:hypothetical protein
MPPMADLPTGTATFLFTDIEGSTRLWEQWPAVMSAVVAHHDAPDLWCELRWVQTRLPGRGQRAERCRWSGRLSMP